MKSGRRLASELNAALAAFRLGDPGGAGRILRRLTREHPDNSGVVHAHGIFLKDCGRYAEAVPVLRRAAELSPGTASLWSDLGVACQKGGNIIGALGAYQRALALDPSRWQVYQNLGCLYEDQKDYEHSEKFYSLCVARKPDCADSWAGLGRVSKCLGKLSDSIGAYKEALRWKPTAEHYCDYAHTLGLNRQYDDAIAAARQAIALNPRLAPAHCHVGKALLRKECLLEAKQCFETALAADAGCTEAMEGLANIARQFCNYEEAVSFCVRAMERSPGRSTTHSGLLFLLSSASLATHRQILEAHQGWERMHAAKAVPFRHAPKPGDAGRKLRIGFVSGDFRDHAVRAFIAPMLRGLNRREFEVICYSNSPNSDHATVALIALADAWREIAFRSDDEAGRQIRSDGIDILVDLSGHTDGNRLLVFAGKPAPVQVTWLGYGDTTGLSTIDYWVTDEVLHPPDTRHLTAERIWRLPRCWVAYEPPENAPAIVARTAAGPVTFASFNALQKSSPESIRLWAAVLAAVPESRLLVKVHAGPAERALLSSRLTAAGMPAERIAVRGHTPTRQEHFALFNEVDIALDTTPYSGGTTTAEALWMGVPVITAPGERMLSRMSASMLHSVGLDELIARDAADFVRIARDLAGDAGRRNALRAGLRARVAASPLCDGPGLARTMGDAFRQMWAAWCAAEYSEVTR